MARTDHRAAACGGRENLWLPILVIVFAGGCGAKTGLLIPDADASLDAEADVRPDADLPCVPETVDIEQRLGEVIFVIDRSWSMAWPLEPGDSRSRWTLLRSALAEVLPSTDDRLAIGGKFYPYEGDPSSCESPPGVEVPPAPHNTRAFMSYFDRVLDPVGGTPTAAALAEARDYFIEHPNPDTARFVVLTTDGGPNCNPETWNPHEPCICTDTPEFCVEPADAMFNCLDVIGTLESIESTYVGLGIPVYIIAIDDPTRPDLADFMDDMAVTGGRPRTDPGERAFYSIRREGDLVGALDTITSTIARCLFVVDPVPAPEEIIDVRINGDSVPRDPTGSDGWDWTDRDAGEITLFGSACERATAPRTTVRAIIECE